MFPTFDQLTLATLIREDLTDRGKRSEVIEHSRSKYARDLLLALEDNIRSTSITTDGARSILKRLTENAGIDIDHPKQDYGSHGGRLGMGEVLLWAFGYTGVFKDTESGDLNVLRNCIQ